MLTHMAHLLTHMACVARLLTRMTRWLTYYTYLLEFNESASRISRANNDVSCSKFQNHSLTQTNYKMAQFKRPSGTYD